MRYTIAPRLSGVLRDAPNPLLQCRSWHDWRQMQPLILVDPLPRTLAMICDPPTRARLEQLGRLVIHEDGPMPDELVERHLPEVTAILGQTAMPAERLERAPRLRAIVNVEGNFLPNVD